MLWLYKRVIFGKITNDNLKKILDLNKYELIILIILAFPCIFFGFYTEPLISTTEASVANLLNMYNSNIELNQLRINND